jgi:SAM-dependent methyltransferase
MSHIDTAAHTHASQGNSWIDTLIHSLDSEQSSPLGEKLPEFPSEELQRNTTGLSSEAAIRQAYAFYENVVDASNQAGLVLNSKTKALDFGFGWGRISRVFMEKISVENIYGVDVDPSFVEITREMFKSDKFQLCEPFPPTKFEDASFDLVYAYSVFSHLSEAACQAWMQEFVRILKPGGLVAFTTRHESFFDFCEWAKNQPAKDSSYIHALGQLFPDIKIARETYRQGKIVHGSSSGVGGGGPRDSSFYGETWIPELYAKSKFGDQLEFVAGYFDGSKYDQACFALKRVK